MSDNPFRLDNEIALITGGGTGLGLGIAQCFIEAGARVVIVGRRADVLREACAQLGSRASFFDHDICQFDKNEGLIASIEQSVGAPTILVNNAGTHLKRPAVDVSVEEFKALMDTHVFAAHSLSAACLRRMIPAKRGSIVFIASMTSYLGVPQVVAYSAAKSAYLGMVRAIAADYSGEGIRVNGIAPGWIQTPMLERAMAGDEPRRTKVLSRTPMKRFGEPRDIGLAAVYLCSPAAKFVTGTILPVDGGASIGF